MSLVLCIFDSPHPPPKKCHTTFKIQLDFLVELKEVRIFSGCLYCKNSLHFTPCQRDQVNQGPVSKNICTSPEIQNPAEPAKEQEIRETPRLLSD